MSLIAQRIADTIHQNSPSVYCFTCLAAQQGVKEHDVRAVAVVLVVRQDLRLVRQVCSRCHGWGEAVAAQKLA